MILTSLRQHPTSTVDPVHPPAMIVFAPHPAKTDAKAEEGFGLLSVITCY